MNQKAGTADAKRPDPPEHLSKQMKEFWTGVFERKNLQPHEAIIFLKACEAHDRGEQARQTLDREGCTYEDRFKQPHSRPEVAIERDSRAAFAKLLSQINLHTPVAW
jgi:P27 family predicted phage terminase small subunit